MSKQIGLYTLFVVFSLVLSACAPAAVASQATGAISGLVWHDACASGLDGQPVPAAAPEGCVADASALGAYHADGALGAGEDSIEGVMVELRQGACAEAGWQTLARTSATEAYSFTDLSAGTYCVSIDPQREPNFGLLRPGIWTAPVVSEGIASTTVVVEPGQHVTGIDFGWDYQFLPDTAVDAPASGELREIPVSAVTLDVGVGSPIPVTLLVSGTWPDLCAQLAEVRQQVSGNRIDVTLLASPADPTCPPDYLGLPFALDIPVNAVELPTGMYTVVVNGVSAELEIDPVKALEAMPRIEGALVDSVEVQIGVGSPLPVTVVASGSFPNTCAQVKSIEQDLAGNAFEIIILTRTPPGADCLADPLPFTVSVPLNVVDLEPGQYTVRVNDVSAEFAFGVAP